MMNYIKEINAFYQIQETNQLSSTAANVWHVLLHVNNRAGWKREFTVAMSGVCFKANISLSTFRRARAELVEKGYLSFRSRSGNRSAVYQMVSLEEKLHGTQTPQADPVQKEPDTVPPTLLVKMNGKTEHNVSTLVKQNKMKQTRDTAAAEAVTFFEHHIGHPTPLITTEIAGWVRKLKAPLVLCAMERAREHGKTNWGYIRGILTAWEGKGFQTVADTEKERAAFKRRFQTRSKYPRRAAAHEVIPDWFRDRAQPEAVAESDTATEASARAELAQLIKAYS